MPEPQEIINEIRGRWSVADLRGMSDADLDAADERFYAAKTEMEIVDQGRNGVIDWWQIWSDGNRYDCRRFKNFVWCSCLGFFYTKRMCKHLALTTGVKCERCGELRARKGKLCYDCDQVVNKFRNFTNNRKNI